MEFGNCLERGHGVLFKNPVSHHSLLCFAGVGIVSPREIAQAHVGFRNKDAPGELCLSLGINLKPFIHTTPTTVMLLG